MRHLLANIVLSAALLSATQGWAFAPGDESFEQDRKLAEVSITKEQQQRCLEDFSHKAKNQPIALNGDFSFNDFLSHQVYDVMYWKNASHGVVFTVPVRSSDAKRGEVVANLACFYSLANDGIEFQHSQQVVWRFF